MAETDNNQPSEINRTYNQTHSGSGDNVAGDKNTYIQQPPELRSPRTGRINNLARRGIEDPSRFVGRDGELRQLDEKLGEASVVAIAGVVGMGGVGKTELAVQFARQRGDRFDGGVVWLAGARLLSELVAIAQREFLTLADMEMLGKLSTPADQAQFCWARWPEGSVLAIVDDITEYKTTIQPLLPPGDRFRALLTTRDRRLLPPDDCLFLDVLTQGRSLELLGQLIGEDRLEQERDGAVMLVERLGRLPLAIELVGAYLQELEDLSLAQMLGRLEAKGLGSVALTEVPQVVQAERGVSAAFELSWERLSAGAQRLAVLLGCFGCAPVPWNLVQDCLPEEDEEQLEHWRSRELVRLSLLERQGKGLYGLHPLIWEFFGEKRSDQEDGDDLQQAFLRVMVEVAETVSPTPTRRKQNSIHTAVPHIERTLEWTHLIEDSNCTWPFTALIHLAKAQNSWAIARQYCVTALEMAQIRFGPSHPRTALCLNHLAGLEYKLGDYLQAKSLYEDALDISRDRLGEEHLFTASNLNNLGQVYSAQGQYEDAKSCFSKSLEIEIMQLGSDHPDVAQRFNNLATVHEYQGCYEQAAVFYSRSLEIRESKLHPEHPEIAESLNNLAGLHATQGHYDLAKPLYLRVLKIWHLSLGKNSRETANVLGNLGELYRAQKMYGEAEVHHLKALAIQEMQLGPNHPDVAQTLNSLGWLYNHHNQSYKESEAFYKRALKIREVSLGKDHPDVAQSLNSLGELYRLRGSYQRAARHHKDALKIRRLCLPHNHPDIAISLNNLGMLYFSWKKYSQVEHFLLESIDIYRDSLGDAHPTTQLFVQNLAAFIEFALVSPPTVRFSAHPLTQHILQQLQRQNPN